MELSYLDIRKAIKKIYGHGLYSLSKGDEKSINYLLLDLDRLKNIIDKIIIVDNNDLKKEAYIVYRFLADKLKEKQHKDLLIKKRKEKK